MDPKPLNPKAQDLAQRLLAYEAAGNSSTENKSAAFRVSEKLRRPLSTLAGSAGFDVLLGRALKLAKNRVPTLGTVQVKPDGSLDGLISEFHKNDNAAKDDSALIAQLIDLLFTFIGEDLTLRLVLDAWPVLPLFVPKPDRESEHDPTR